MVTSYPIGEIFNMLISPIANKTAISKIQSNNTENKEISSQKVLTTLPSFADAKSLVNINFKARIHDCVRWSNWKNVQEELDKGVGVNSRDYSDTDHNTPLIIACHYGRIDIVEKLLQHPDIDVNARNVGGFTALHWASYNKNAKLAEKLLEHPDININLSDRLGKIALDYANDEIAEMIRTYKRGVDKRSGLIQTQPQKQEAQTDVNEKEDIKTFMRVLDSYDVNEIDKLLDKRFGKTLQKSVDIPEDEEQAIREAVTEKIREEERIAARKEYEDKNSALDNLINDYQSILAEDISAERDTLESGFRTLYGVKSEDLPENMGFGEQMIYVVDILSKHKDKLSSVSAEYPKTITRALQDKSGKISNDGLKFLDRVLQVSDKKCSENDLVSSIDAVKNDKGLLDMEKVSYLIANLSWGQNSISDVAKDVKEYNPQKN